MSSEIETVFRIITRIIPLNSPGSTFEPASFEQLVDGPVGEIKVLNLTEPESGLEYRIERIQIKQKAGPGETIQSINEAYDKKVKNILGFEDIRPGDVPLNPYDKSFQVSFPKVLIGTEADDCSNDSQKSKSFKISVVKNCNFKKASPKKKPVTPDKTEREIIKDKNKTSPKKSILCLTPDKTEKEKIKDKNKASPRKKSALFLTTEKEKIKDKNNVKSPPKYLNDSKSPFKSKYPSYLSKKLKNSVWKKKNKSPRKLKSTKHSETKNLNNGFFSECATEEESKQDLGCPTSNYMRIDQDIDVRNTLDRILNANFSEEETVNHNEPDAKKLKLSITDDEETDFTDNSLDSDSGALVINVTDDADVSDKSCSKNEKLESLNSNEQPKENSNASEDSLLKDSFDVTNQAENSEVLQDSKNKDNDNICEKYNVSEGHPAHDLLVALKKYFLNGECLICGFIPDDKYFNACEHMESHVLCNSFASSYKCSCCDDKFPDPRNLYMHALSREKTYNYVCSICTLKFKRRHYLLRHTSKSH